MDNWRYYLIFGEFFFLLVVEKVEFDFEFVVLYFEDEWRNLI